MKILVWIILVFIVLFFAIMLKSNSESDDDTTHSPESPYIHYANNPNKVWDGPSFTILNPVCSESKKNRDLDRTIKSIKVLSSEQDIRGGKIYSGIISMKMDIDVDTSYLCKITYESGRTEVRKYSLFFLKSHSDLIV